MAFWVLIIGVILALAAPGVWATVGVGLAIAGGAVLLLQAILFIAVLVGASKVDRF